VGARPPGATPVPAARPGNDGALPSRFLLCRWCRCGWLDYRRPSRTEGQQLVGSRSASKLRAVAWYWRPFIMMPAIVRDLRRLVSRRTEPLRALPWRDWCAGLRGRLRGDGVGPSAIRLLYGMRGTSGPGARRPHLRLSQARPIWWAAARGSLRWSPCCSRWRFLRSSRVLRKSAPGVLWGRRVAASAPGRFECCFRREGEPKDGTRSSPRSRGQSLHLSYIRE